MTDDALDRDRGVVLEIRIAPPRASPSQGLLVHVTDEILRYNQRHLIHDRLDQALDSYVAMFAKEAAQ